jgi:SAM-dependent methyltransferase
MTMPPTGPQEFDRYGHNYEALVREPSRNWFGDPLFFHRRKLELLLRLLAAIKRDASSLDWLDVGCGNGTLLALGKDYFRRAYGCDVSAGMIEGGSVSDVRLQSDSTRLPYADQSMDLITAVCVYHHVPPADRQRLTEDIRRVLRPHGIFAIIEHNPRNPWTRLVVKRSPVDADAVLLSASEAEQLQRQVGLNTLSPVFFLYVPSLLYRILGSLERALTGIPFGGQYSQIGIAGPIV